MLAKAKAIVDERMAKYGVPTESWSRIGRMWGAYLGIKAIPAWKCLHMMSQMKEVRETYERNPDNNLDAVGYIDCAERVILAEEEEDPSFDSVSARFTLGKLPGENPNPWKPTYIDKKE